MNHDVKRLTADQGLQCSAESLGFAGMSFRLGCPLALASAIFVWSGCSFLFREAGASAADSGSDSAADADSACAQGAAPQPLGCLVDDFNDGARDANRWDIFAGPGRSVYESGDSLVVEFLDGQDDSYAGYTAVEQWDFRGSSAFVCVSGIPAADSIGGLTSVFNVIVDTPDKHLLTFNLSGPDLFMSWATNDAPPAILGLLSYDPTNHRCWRIRESEGDVLWETSPDGDTWNLEGTLEQFPGDASSARVSIASGSYESLNAVVQNKFIVTGINTKQ